MSLVIATDDFLGENDTELSFKKGDLIILLDNKVEEGWLCGISQGKKKQCHKKVKDKKN